MALPTKIYTISIITLIYLSGCSNVGYDVNFDTKMAQDDKYFLDLHRKQLVKNKTNYNKYQKHSVAQKSITKHPKIIDMSYSNISNKQSAYYNHQKTGIKKHYKIIAQDMPVDQFLYYIFQEILVNDFSVDPKIKTIKEKITLKIDKFLTKEELVNLLKDLLKTYNVKIEEKEHIFRATYTKKFPREAMGGNLITSQKIQSNISDDTIISQYIELNYLDKSDFINLAAGLYYKDVTIRPVKGQNGFIVNGKYGEIKKIFDFKQIVDKPFMLSKHTVLIYFDYITPSDFEKDFKKILKYQNLDDIKMLSLNSINSMLVITSNKSSLRFLMKWKEKFDTYKKSTDRKETYFYYSRYRSIKEISELLNKFNGTAVSMNIQKNKNINQINDNNKKEFVETEKKDLKSEQKSVTLQNITSQKKEGVKIITDEARNMLIIRATPLEYKKILDVLNKIDTQPLQLLVEANIIEVTLKNDLQYGMEWFLKNKASGDTTAIKVLGQSKVGIGSSGFFGIVSNNYFNTMLNLFAQKNLINVLSNPKILVLNGEDATIQVGERIPTLSSTMSNVSNPENSVSTVSYSNTGLNLTVKPSVTANGVITMDISQTISKGQKNGLSNISSPIILNRQINTKMVLRDNQSVIMGGLIQQDVSTTKTKVPFLSNLPGIGNLFQSTSNNKTKTELVLLIKVHIIDKFELLDEVKTKFNRLLSMAKNNTQVCNSRNIDLSYQDINQQDILPAREIETIQETKPQIKRYKKISKKPRKRIHKRKKIPTYVHPMQKVKVSKHSENLDDLPIAPTYPVDDLPVSKTYTTPTTHKSIEDLPLAKTIPVD